MPNSINRQLHHDEMIFISEQNAHPLERLRQWISRTLIRADDELLLRKEICRLTVEIGRYSQCSFIAWDSAQQAFSRTDHSHDHQPARIIFDHPIYAHILKTGQFRHVPFAHLKRVVAPAGALSAILIPVVDCNGTELAVMEVYLPMAEQNLQECSMLKTMADDIANRMSELRRIHQYQQQLNELSLLNERNKDHLSYLQNIDQVTRILQSAGDSRQIVQTALDLILDIFAVDKVLLSSPCDPDTDSWQIHIRSHRPQYPPILELNTKLPVMPEAAAFFKALLQSEEPVAFGSGAVFFSPTGQKQRYSTPLLASKALATAIYPKSDAPWVLTIISMDSNHDWSAIDRKVFKEIGRRLSMGLTTWLNYEHLEEREAQLQSLVRAIPDLVWQKDKDGKFLNCNRELEALFGVPIQEIIGKSSFDFYPQEQAEIFSEEDRLVITEGQSIHSEHWMTFVKTNYQGLFELTKRPILDTHGNVIGLVGIGHDVTERKQAEQELRIAATTFNSQEAIAITDARTNILRVNQAFCDISGYSSEEVVGKTPRMLASGRHDNTFYEQMWRQLRQHGHWKGEIWNRRKNGEIYPEWLTINTVKDAYGNVSNYVGTFLDLTSNKQAEQEIQRLAFYDLLTGLPNRRLFMNRLKQAQTNRSRSEHINAVILIDLDNFKVINDSGGHAIGDSLLVQVAERLQSFIFEGDTAARLGGDEFIVLLEELSINPQHAASQTKNIAEQILQLLAQPYTIGGHIYHSTPSIGVTMMVSPEEEIDDLIRQADIAMYQAKNAGRNTLRFFDPQMQSSLTQRASLEMELREAIEQQQLQLHYQPQVNESGHIIGAEALVRWHHPVRGMIFPDQFIPLAEQSGLILPLGQWVLEHACRQLHIWSGEQATRELVLAVNVSARQFRQDNFVELVQQSLTGSGASSSRLKLEMTETLILDDVNGTIAKMRQLENIGIGFSLDDFGTGYSSLSYLTQLPLEQVKIDRSFIRNLPNNDNDAMVVQSIISLTQSLGLKVIAEGVETEEQKDFLNQYGCQHCQGYLFGRPIPITDFELLLRHRNATHEYISSLT